MFQIISKIKMPMALLCVTNTFRPCGAASQVHQERYLHVDTRLAQLERQCSARSTGSCQSYKSTGTVQSRYSETTVTLDAMNAGRPTKACNRALLVTMAGRGSTADGFRQGCVADGVRMMNLLKSKDFEVLWLRDFEPQTLYYREAGFQITEVDESEKDEDGVTPVYVVAQTVDNVRKPANERNMYTKSAFKKALTWLTNGTESGDNRFFYYSGHGSKTTKMWCRRKYSLSSIEDVDDAYLRTNLIEQLGEDVNLTMMFDCCHSGGMGDRLEEFPSRGIYDASDKKANVLMIAACEEQEKTNSAFTLRFLQAIKVLDSEGRQLSDEDIKAQGPSKISLVKAMEDTHNVIKETMVIKSSHVLHPRTSCEALFGVYSKVPANPATRRRLINRLARDENNF